MTISRKMAKILCEARKEIDALPKRVRDIFERNRQLRLQAESQELGLPDTIPPFDSW